MNIKLAGVVAGMVVTLLGGLGLILLDLWLEDDGKAPESAQEAVFQGVWKGLTEDKREDACLAITLVGVDGVERLLASELTGTPADPEYLAQRMAEECAR